jgi:hypothetical protein
LVPPWWGVGQVAGEVMLRIDAMRLGTGEEPVPERGSAAYLVMCGEASTCVLWRRVCVPIRPRCINTEALGVQWHSACHWLRA